MNMWGQELYGKCMYLPLNFSVNLKLLFKTKKSYFLPLSFRVFYTCQLGLVGFLLFNYSVYFFIFCLDVLHYRQWSIEISKYYCRALFLLSILWKIVSPTLRLCFGGNMWLHLLYLLDELTLLSIYNVLFCVL